MEDSSFITPEHKKILAQARMTLCQLTDDIINRVHPASEEYKKITDIIAQIEKLMGII